MTQLAFDLTGGEAFGRADFFVSDANAAALGWVDRWPQWPSPVLVLHGARGAGKTHLAHLWRQRAAAILVAGESLDHAHVDGIIAGSGTNFVVDDAEHAPETALLHLFNACLEAGGNLLLTSRQAAGSWRPALADLGSRLCAAPSVGIGGPDDALLAAVLAKHFADRQIRVASEVITYLVCHMERSFHAAGEISAALDHAALSGNRAITTRLANQVLAARANQPRPPEAGTA